MFESRNATIIFALNLGCDLLTNQRTSKECKALVNKDDDAGALLTI